MQFNFDLISDLHLDTWPHEIDWDGRATSNYAVVLGDVCRNKDNLVCALEALAQCYQAVFYIDGNDEHVGHWNDLEGSYTDLKRRLDVIDRLVYLQDNVVVINGVAILGTNGWWGFDLDPTIDPHDAQQWWIEKWRQQSEIVTRENAVHIAAMSRSDATYLASSVNRLQTHMDVKKIVVVTHTVPRAELIQHDVDLDGCYRFNTMGNSNMNLVLAADRMKKITTWCFGHYHGSVDQTRDGVRYVNNCRGRHGTAWSHYVYHPLRIEIQI